MPKFRHTPLTAAKAIRALVEDDIPKTLEDLGVQYDERSRLPANQWGRWMTAFRVGCLVSEQCNGLPRNPGQKPHQWPFYDWLEIQLAIQQVFPELFADYVEKLFEAEKQNLTV